MKMNNYYEVELSLKDFLFHVLYKWWFILLIGLISAGVFGFREYWSFEKYHRTGELAPAEVKYEADVSSWEKSLENAEKTLAEYEAMVKDANGDRSVSILMGIDPANIWTAEKKYYVNVSGGSSGLDLDADSADSSTRILAFLGDAFSVDIEDDKLMEVFGTIVRKDYSDIACICINKKLNTISVIGCGANEEEARKRKDFVDSYLTVASEELSKKEKYSLELISDSVGAKTVLITRDLNGEKVEKNLATLQRTANENYQNYQNQVAAYRRNRDNLLNNVPVKPTLKVKSQAVTGLFIGVLIAVVLCTVVYLFNGKLKTGRELKNRYDLPVLSEFTHSRALWKEKGIDWVLEKLEFGKKTDSQNELDSIASLIDEEKDGKTILLTGTLDEKTLKSIYDVLSSRLREKGIELALEADYLHNSEAVVASREMDSVLLVEEKYKSRIRDLNRMAEMLTIEDVDVVGAVLL